MDRRVSSRLALVALTLIASSAAIPSPPATIRRRNDAPPLPPCTSFTPFTYVGCFYEANPMTLQYNPNLDFDTMTIEICTSTCKSNGYRYAGLEYYGECFCGTMLSTPAPETDCDVPCEGDANETCGANQRISIWEDSTYPSVDLTTIVSDYQPLGCYIEGVDYRAIPYRQNQLSSSNLTTAECLAACGSEYYPLAGTEYGGECYCGVMLQDGSAPAPATDCNVPCTGNTTDMCGGPDRLNVYVASILESTEPCATTNSTSSSSTSSSAPTSTSSSAPTSISSSAPTSTSASTTSTTISSSVSTSASSSTSTSCSSSSSSTSSSSPSSPSSSTSSTSSSSSSSPSSPSSSTSSTSSTSTSSASSTSSSSSSSSSTKSTSTTSTSTSISTSASTSTSTSHTTSSTRPCTTTSTTSTSTRPCSTSTTSTSTRPSSTSTTSTSTRPCSSSTLLTSTSTKKATSTSTSSKPASTTSCTSGTAYGYIPGLSTTFTSLGICNNWGWVINGNVPISGNLYMGALNNNLNAATIVGTFDIVRSGGNLVVTYTVNPPYDLQTNFYYDSKCPNSVVPANFGNCHNNLQCTRTDQYVIPYYSSKKTYIVHADIGCSC